MPYTHYRSFKLFKGLHLEERVGGTSLKARASLKGKLRTFDTETTDFHRAEREALSWFRRLEPSGSNPRAHHTMHDAAKDFLLGQTGWKLRDYTNKWNAFSELFIGLDVEDITTPVLKDFFRKRKAKALQDGISIKPTTLHKDAVTIRRILFHAVEEGWLPALPTFPELDSIKANPRPWLEKDEWEALQRVARQRIDEATNPRSKKQREDLLDFCILMVSSCCRVDELRALKKRDCTVRMPKTPPNTFTVRPTATGVGYESVPPQSYLELRVNGKTGVRHPVANHDAVEAYERIVARHGLTDGQKLFKELQREGFKLLLTDERLDLRFNVHNQPRNLKCLRCTGLMLKVLKNPRINLKLLADAVGSSMTMLSEYYLKPLTIDMNVEELLD